MSDQDRNQDQDQDQDQTQQAGRDEDTQLSGEELEDVSGGGCMTFVDSAGCSSSKH